MATSIFIIRHGAYERRPMPGGNEASSDHGLSALGRRQVDALRERLARTGEIRADALFSSTLPRARQTAELIASSVGAQPLALEELCEWESGNEAIDAAEWKAQFDRLSALERRDHRFAPGCETLREFTRRVQGKLADLEARFEGKTIALVVHGGVVRAAFARFVGVDSDLFDGGYPAAGHASITLWRRSDVSRHWVQEFANDTHHLHGVVCAEPLASASTGTVDHGATGDG